MRVLLLFFEFPRIERNVRALNRSENGFGWRDDEADSGPWRLITLPAAWIATCGGAGQSVTTVWQFPTNGYETIALA